VETLLFVSPELRSRDFASGKVREALKEEAHLSATAIQHLRIPRDRLHDYLIGGNWTGIYAAPDFNVLPYEKKISVMSVHAKLRLIF